MNPISRAISVLTAPAPTMSKAAGEPATTQGLIVGYAALLSALPAVAMLVLTLLRVGGAGLGSVIVSLILMFVATWLIRDLGVAILIGLGLAALAPNFGGRKDSVNAMKLAVYAATPIWIAALLMVLLVFLVPTLGGLAYIILLLGFAFAGYIIYVGCGPLLGVPQNQAPVVAGIATIAWLVLYFVAEQIVARVFTGAMYSSYGI
jgi:hypothetical protein